MQIHRAVLVLTSCLALQACGTARATTGSLVSPVLSVAAPEADPDDDCAEQAPLVAPYASPRRLRIGNWNMHYLGPSEKTPDEQRDPRELADYIRQSKVSVLALEEIGVSGNTDRPRSAMLDAIFEDLRRDGADWTYRLYGDPEDLNQFTGLAWDRRVVTQVGTPAAIHVSGAPPGWLLPFVHLPFETKIWLREPFAIQLSAGPGLTDLVFVPIHLTARVETFFFEDSTDHREAEIAALTEHLEDIAGVFGDRDIVILGDFNTELATERVSIALIEKGWRDLNCDDTATYLPFRMSLDRIFVPRDQREFALDPDFAVVSPPDVSVLDFLQRYSDHRMVVADVIVAADDD